MKTKHPNIKALNETIRLLKLQQEKYPGVDMGDLDLRHECKTPGCFAGHLQIAHRFPMDKKYGYSFIETADHWARLLGFSSKTSTRPHEKLELWADRNPKIWGNEHGYAMFGGSKAYGSTKEKITLNRIIKHLEGVSKRLKEAT